MDFSKHIGKTVKARDGMQTTIIAHVPEAVEQHQLVVVGADKRVRTCTIEGHFIRHSEAHPFDLMPPTKTIRMRAYRDPTGKHWVITENQWPDFQLGVDTGKASWVSEPFDVEIEA